MMKKRKLQRTLALVEEKLGTANKTVHDQMKHIDMINRQLDLQDKAIERKDNQFLGLRCAYQDEIINKL